MSAPLIAVPGISAASFKQHPLHGEAAAWPETNCYIDLWIEALHALGLDPIAMLPFCLSADFEGDQWTFTKPSLDDLWSLYGIDVQELNIWETVAGHVVEQIERGRVVLVEVDSFYLPDTGGIAYRIEHSKTTIGVNEIDLDTRRLGYFHNSGYFMLEGDDFGDVLGLNKIAAAGNTSLFPYVEFAKVERRIALSPTDLREASLAAARRHLARRPPTNPFRQSRERFALDIAMLIEKPSAYYHKYAFASLRQFGAAFQLSSVYLRWLDATGSGRFEDVALCFDAISDSAKVLLFKAARAVNGKKPLAFEAQYDELESAWDRAFSALPDLLERRLEG